MNLHPAYRPDIDGLRAIAILSVLIFHAFPAYLGGGFIGVDIFFVISGFLISSILFKEFQAGTFSFKTFYQRRIRRLFPALILVLLATYFAGWMLLLPEEFVQLGKHMASGMGFIANFTLLDEAGYFDTEAALKPLLHLWSLGIEEQFYIVWPFLLFGLGKWRRGLVPVATTLFVASMMYNLIESYDDVEDAFFLPYSRFWEFSGGVALAYLVTHYPERFRHEALIARYPLLSKCQATDLVSITGIALIGFSLIWFRQDMVFPGWRAILPVLGATLLIASRKAWFNRVVLSSRPMVWIGLISYPLYLWHWPIISFLHVIKMPTDGWVMGCALALSVVLAWLTYNIVEKRVRAQCTDYYMRTLCLMAVGVLVVGLMTARGWIKPYLNIAELNQMMEALQDWEYPPPGGVKEKLDKQSLYRYASDNKDEVVYVGDSNMEHFAPRVAHLIATAPQQTFTAVFITAGGCRPVPNVTKGGDVRCYALLPHVMEYLDSHPVKRLVLSGRWHDFLSFSTLSYRFPDGRTVPISEPKAQEALMKDMNAFIRAVQVKGVEVVLIHNVPSGIPDMGGPAINRFDLIRLKWTNSPYKPRREFPVSEGLDEKSRDMVKSWAKHTNAMLIDPTQDLCKGSLCPLFYNGDEGIYKDITHLSYTYARNHATFMDQTILKGE